MNAPVQTRAAQPAMPPRPKPATIHITTSSPKELGWPDTYDEQARLAAQRDARLAIKRRDVLVFAVPHKQRAPLEILADKRWKKQPKPHQIQNLVTGQILKFDIYQAWIVLLSGRVVAQGLNIWKVIFDIYDQLKPAQIRFGHVLDGTVNPWDRFARGKHTLIFLSTVDGDIWYYDSEQQCIRETSHREFLDTIAWGAFAKAGQSAEGMVLLYRSMVYFGVTVIPGGTEMRLGVTALGMANFWHHHKDEIQACYETLERVIKCLRVIYTKAPKLGAAMLRLALQQSVLNIADAVKKDGLVKVVLSNLDGDKLMKYIAELFGLLFKFALNPQGATGWVAKGLSKLGLTQLAKVASVVAKWMKFKSAVGKVATGGGVKDPQDLATAFLKLFAEAGASLTQEEANGILAEDAQHGPEVLRAVEQLNEICGPLQQLIKKLADEAKRELF